MDEDRERQPLLNSNGGSDGDRERRSSVVSFSQHDSGNPLEWSDKYKWFSVGLLCMYATVVYGKLMDFFPLCIDRETGRIPALGSFPSPAMLCRT